MLRRIRPAAKAKSGIFVEGGKETRITTKINIFSVCTVCVLDNKLRLNGSIENNKILLRLAMCRCACLEIDFCCLVVVFLNVQRH